MTYELGIIGAGNMAEAIARGVMTTKLLNPGQIIASDVSEARRTLFQNELGITCVSDTSRVAREARTMILCVKPQQMKELCATLAPLISNDHLIVSIAAGISTTFIQEHLKHDQRLRIVRVMPNTPMLVSEGMIAIAPGAGATRDDVQEVRHLFESAGDVIEVNEDQMDAVTALSGSGPAYVFLLIEQMIRAGVEMGLSPEHARKLSIKTVFGAGRMQMMSDESPESLRAKVTSPNGTTHAAITSMQESKVPEAIVRAIRAAERRGKELGF